MYVANAYEYKCSDLELDDYISLEDRYNQMLLAYDVIMRPM